MRQAMETERERLSARLEAIAKPRMRMSQGEQLSLQARWNRDTKARDEWAAANPELEAEHGAILDRLRVLDLEAEEMRRAAEEAERVAGALEECVGPRIAAALAAPNPKTKAWEGLADFQARNLRFLLLTGVAGTGKSVAAARLLQVAIASRRSVMLIRAAEAARMSLYDPADRATVERMRRVSTLVVDDLGLELLGDVWRQTLDDVIDARYSRRLETALTTNLDPAGFKARYGDRIADRIRHDGLVVQCGAASMRKRPA